MKGILSLSVVLVVSLFCLPAAENGGLTPENTVICSNETDESFCRDFSVLLGRVRPEWVILDSAEIPESVRERNLIIIGELDAEYTGDIIREVIAQEEANYIRQNNYSVLEKESPWAENKIIYICTGSDKLLTKKAAEEALTSLEGEWTYPPFPSVPYEEARKYITQLQYIPEDEELPKDALSMDVDANLPSRISTEEAFKDVEYLFYLFSHGYCGYGYFNTEGNFDNAKQAILRELETNSQWSPEDLSQLLYEHLTFIHDCHLKVGDFQYGGHEDFWYDTTLELWKTSGEYYFTSDNVTYNVVSIDEKDPDGFMFPSLNAQGDPIYRIGILSKAAPEPLVLTAQHANGQHQFTIQLTSSDFGYFSKDIFQEVTIGGIPVVRIRSFSDHHAESINQFLETAQKYKGEPCLIIDIRGNGGGNEEWPKTWITQFTGRKPSSKRYFTEFISKTTMMGRANSFEYLLDMYPETHTYQTEIDRYNAQADLFEKQYMVPHWTGPFSEDAQVIPNDTMLIVVINSKVGSAAEGFINYLQQVENLVLVGENSRGALVFGQVSSHRLPHSTLRVQLPISLNIPLDLKFREEKGFFPHLWIPAEDAVNYVVAAVRKGTITTVHPLPEEVLREEFIPEAPPRNVMIYLIPTPILVILGFVLVFVFKKKTLSFLAFGMSWFPIGVVALSQESSLGYVAIIAGLAYIMIGVYKLKKEKAALETDS